MNATDSKEFYESFSWAVIVGISLVFLFYAYLFSRLASITQRPRWRVTFELLAVAFFLIGSWRLVVALLYFQNYSAKLAFPITAAISYAAIAAGGYAFVKWAEQAAIRFRVNKENFDLSEAASREIFEPILRGDPSVTKEKIAEHQARSLAYAHGLK